MKNTSTPDLRCKILLLVLVGVFVCLFNINQLYIHITFLLLLGNPAGTGGRESLPV